MRPYVVALAAACCGFLLTLALLAYKRVANERRLWWMAALAAGPAAMVGGVATLFLADSVALTAASLAGAGPGLWWTMRTLSRRDAAANYNAATLTMVLANRMQRAGRIDDAVELMLSLPDNLDESLRLWRGTDLAYAYYNAGRHDAARVWLDEVEALVRKNASQPPVRLAGDVAERRAALYSSLAPPSAPRSI